MMFSSIPAEQVARTVYRAATVGKDQIRYFVGQDTQTLYQRRLKIGNEAHRMEIRDQFSG